MERMPNTEGPTWGRGGWWGQHNIVFQNWSWGGQTSDMKAWIRKRVIYMSEIISQWLKIWRIIPPPQEVKHQILRQYAKRFQLRTLVETGTLRGDTIAALQNDFDKLYSIELSDVLYQRACDRFKNISNVELVHGDSSIVLAEVVHKLSTPALFRLDGHYSHGDDEAKKHHIAMGAKEFPLVEELNIVLSDPNHGHVILADDARYFGVCEYPTLQEIQGIVRKHKPGWHVEYADE